MEPPDQRRPAADPTYFGLLADSERRHALRALSTMEQPVDLRALALRVTARELGKPASRVDPEELERREIRLYHNHLSRMEDYGIVRFDANDRTVELRDAPRTEMVLDSISGLDSR